MSEFTWVIPTFQAVGTGVGLYANRKAIQDVLEQFRNRFTSKTRIAVMGMSGVGKTVLIDYVLGRGGIGYKTPLTSQRAEYEVIKIEDKNLEFIIVPGQEQSPRREALEELEKNPPDGIIHVFANGYANNRNTTAQASLIEQGIDTIEKIRDENLDRELADLEGTCSFIERIHSKYQKPQWILVAATKIDLYADADNLRAAEKQYKYSDFNNSDNNSQFVNTLNNLVRKIGNQNIRWEAFHVCSRLEAFEWNGERHMLNIVDENQRDRLLYNFISSMTNYC
jgi:GTPase SAR1 family protein